MRRFLVDYARARNAQRRHANPLILQISELGGAGRGLDAVVLADLLDQLAAEEPRMAEVVDLRCFGGLTFAETAKVIDVDERTAKRDWEVASSWLRGHLKKRGAQ